MKPLVSQTQERFVVRRQLVLGFGVFGSEIYGVVIEAMI